MKLLTFNIIGVGSSPKRTVLRRLLDRVNPLVILLLKTMVNESFAFDFFLKITPN